MFQCGLCGGKLEIEAEMRREEVCPHCGAYLHCCLNCRFFVRGISRGCREPQAEEVRDKERANFCDFFFLADGRSSLPSVDRAAAKAQFESLFKKAPERES